MTRSLLDAQCFRWRVERAGLEVGRMIRMLPFMCTGPLESCVDWESHFRSWWGLLHVWRTRDGSWLTFR